MIENTSAKSTPCCAEMPSMDELVNGAAWRRDKDLPAYDFDVKNYILH
jgi:hypothetical protein